MSTAKNLNRSQGAMLATQTTESIEFSAMFGSNINSKWFEWLMTQTGTYLFSFALVLSFIKLSISLYQFVKNPNKNITRTSSLGWTILQTAIIGTALAGVLVAATTFALATPILFVTAMALDTLRNAGLLIWNISKLASLRFSLRKDLNDPLTKLRYDALKEVYLKNIKQHVIGSIIGVVMTAAASIIFLFPHISLVAGIGTTFITIAGAKIISIAGIAGVAAPIALLAPLVSPVLSAIKNLINRFSPGKNLHKVIEQDSLIEKKPQINFPKIANDKPTLNINTRTSLDKTMQHQLNFSAFSLHSRHREIIIEHIVDKDLATTAIQKMLDEKITILAADLQKGKMSGYTYFAEQQRPKREQKLHALLLLKQQLADKKDNSTFTPYESLFKNADRLYKEKFDDMDTLINHIETNFLSVKQSFFLEQSDTQNVIEALKVYAGKFPEANGEIIERIRFKAE